MRLPLLSMAYNRLREIWSFLISLSHQLFVSCIHMHLLRSLITLALVMVLRGRDIIQDAMTASELEKSQCKTNKFCKLCPIASVISPNRCINNIKLRMLRKLKTLKSISDNRDNDRSSMTVCQATSHLLNEKLSCFRKSFGNLISRKSKGISKIDSMNPKLEVQAQEQLLPWSNNMRNYENR